MQLWSNAGAGQVIRVADEEVQTGATFRIVGIVLGEDEFEATKEHFAPRLEKALVTTQRLRTVQLPASLCGLLWRAVVLPQALYGCEVRNIRPTQLVPLASAGKAALQAKVPLELNVWRAPEVLHGPPLGESAVREPLEEVRERQLRWLQLVANLPG